jgi:AraC-like DNA-binding protein
MMLIPSGNDISAQGEDDCELILMRLHGAKQLCDCFPLDKLLSEKTPNFKPNLYYLDINERMDTFLSFLDTCMSDGLRCIYYFELKIKEFYFLLRAYYKKEDLLGFFYPLLSYDIPFSDMILNNHYKVRTVQELAELTHYSLSGFQKHFKKVFGVSAYHWMKDERSKVIFHQINCTNKSFKVISEEYGFSSPSHFNDFCKLHFGTTPGHIRHRNITAK